jgi:hypothetical protein
VAARQTTVSEGSRLARSRSTAPGSANCDPPSPATKYPRRIFPASSIARRTGYSAANPPGTPSPATASRVSTPYRRSSAWACAYSRSVGGAPSASRSETSDHRPVARGWLSLSWGGRR